MSKYSDIDGYIIHRFNFGEADRVLTIFSRQEGKVQAVAKGVRRGHAKLSGHLEPFTLVKLRLAKGRNLDVVIGAEAVKIHEFSKLSPIAQQTAYLTLEILRLLSAEGEPNQPAFDLLQEVFDALMTDLDPLLIRQYFGLQFLQTIGSQPELIDTKLGEHHYLVYGSGLIARDKPQGHYGIMSEDTIKLWRLLLSNDLVQLSRLQNIEDALKEGEELLLRYFQYHFDVTFKSTKVFQEEMI